MNTMRKRVKALEVRAGQETLDMGRPLIWASGQSLDEALVTAGMTLEDGPFQIIRLIAVTDPNASEDDCPLYLRDKHLVE